MVVQGLQYSSSPFLTVNPRRPHLPAPSIVSLQYSLRKGVQNASTNKLIREERISSLRSARNFVCEAIRNGKATPPPPQKEGNDTIQPGVVQSLLWAMEGVYILWLFLLPYAPGDPVWAISSDTINSLVGLSLNFFFILPLMNFAQEVLDLRAVGIHVIEAPVLHPMSEGLFNFVIAWTFMFAPLLFTDCKRNRYKGSLDVLWGFQMFLTNTFLIPYMAIRLSEPDTESTTKEPSKLSTVMVSGAPVVGLIGGAACVLSIVWALFGRMDGDFGIITDRWEFLINYLGSERLAYAFIWDIALYTIFQPWLIGENLQNVENTKVGIVSKLRYVPVVGLAAYLVSLEKNPDS